MTDLTNGLADRATELGRASGTERAAWVIDGNTDDATKAWINKGIADGDPVVMDAYSPPNLSGEYADETELDLARALGLPHPWSPGPAWDAVTDAYELGASEGFWQELERLTTDDTAQGPRDPAALRGWLENVIDAAAAEEGWEVLVQTYAEAGLLTNSEGLVVQLPDGTRYQLTIGPAR